MFAFLRQLYQSWRYSMTPANHKALFPDWHENKPVDNRFNDWRARHPGLSDYQAQKQFLDDTGTPYDFRTMS